MVESILQSFLLLAFFDMTSIAITIAVYAVSASYLGRESRLSRSRMERKRLELVQKLKELRETGEIKDIKKKIGEADAEQRKLAIRILLLSWLGAVILPSMFFVASFICAIVGMNSEVLLQVPEAQRYLERILIGFSSGILAFGFMFLLLVIRTIDSSARAIPIPEFEVYFGVREKTLKLKRNERATIPVHIHNKGEDIGESLEIYVKFPPAFKVYPMGYKVVKQSSESDNPDFNAVIINIELLHIDIIMGADIDLTTPDEKKTYEIPIIIEERKIGISRHKLAIEVVD